MGNIARFSLIVYCFGTVFIPAFAATPDFAAPKQLDGVPIEAVESYANPKTSEINLSVGFYPFNAYYTGICLTGGYTYHASRNFAWEIVDASIFSTFNTGLTTTLADSYNVNPSSIEAVQYMLSTNIDYTFSYGKFVFFEDFIRYFRTAAVLGVGLVDTSLTGYVAPIVGLKLEFLTAGALSWRLDIRDAIAINPDLSGVTNYVTFSIGAGFAF